MELAAAGILRCFLQSMADPVYSAVSVRRAVGATVAGVAGFFTAAGEIVLGLPVEALRV